jgi:hypothetical protein
VRRADGARAKIESAHRKDTSGEVAL